MSKVVNAVIDLCVTEVVGVPLVDVGLRDPHTAMVLDIQWLQILCFIDQSCDASIN